MKPHYLLSYFQKLIKIYKKSRLSVNKADTAYMVVNGNEKKLETEERPIEFCDDCKYLEVPIGK